MNLPAEADTVIIRRGLLRACCVAVCRAFRTAPAPRSSLAGRPIRQLASALALFRREDLRDLQLHVDPLGERRGFGFGNTRPQLIDLRSIGNVGEDCGAKGTLQLHQLTARRLSVGLRPFFVQHCLDLRLLVIGQVQLRQNRKRPARAASSEAGSRPLASRRLTCNCGYRGSGDECRCGNRR